MTRGMFTHLSRLRGGDQIVERDEERVGLAQPPFLSLRNVDRERRLAARDDPSAGRSRFRVSQSRISRTDQAQAGGGDRCRCGDPSAGRGESCGDYGS